MNRDRSTTSRRGKQRSRRYIQPRQVSNISSEINPIAEAHE